MYDVEEISYETPVKQSYRCFYFYINFEIFIGMVVFNFCLNHNLLFTFFSIFSD